MKAEGEVIENSSFFYSREYNPDEKLNLNQIIFIPIEIFNNDSLSSLETVTKYLKEELNYRFRDIAVFLNRSQKTIWDAYNSSKEKMSINFEIEKKISFLVPLLIFKDRSVSFLEALTEYLKDHFNLKYCQIAALLNRDQRTIWTVYNRVKIKRRKDGIL